MSAAAPRSSAGYEPDRVSVVVVVGSALALIAAVLLTNAAVAWYLAVRHGSRPVPPSPEAGAFPASRDWLRAREELDSLHERERTRLETYQWLDDHRTTARIPIRRAMEILAGGQKSGGKP
jgi:hypothetical protein